LKTTSTASIRRGVAGWRGSRAVRLFGAFAAAATVASVAVLAPATPSSAAPVSPRARGDWKVSRDWTDSLTGLRFRVYGTGDNAYSSNLTSETLTFHNVFLYSTQTTGSSATRSSIRARWFATDVGPTTINPFGGWAVGNNGCDFPTVGTAQGGGSLISREWTGSVCRVKVTGWFTGHHLWVEGGHQTTPSHWTFGTASN